MSPRPAVSYAAACLLAAAPSLAFAQLNTNTSSATANSTTGSTITTVTSAAAKPTTHVIEWDLTSMPDQLDGNPGAMVVDTRGEDNNRLWFVTRVASGSAQKVYRFSPPRSLKTADASWTGWELRPAEFGVTGGVTKMRPSHDRRFLFVRMPGEVSNVQRVDTVNSLRTVWTFAGETELFVSDIAVDDRNRVFTTGVNGADANGYVQMIDASIVPQPGTGAQPVTVTRWTGLQGAGQCLAVDQAPDGTQTLGPSGICNSGIDVHPSKQNLVYFVERGTDDHGFITELNIDPRAVKTDPTGALMSPVRRWSLLELSTLTGDNIAGPRVLKIDRSGKVWINTDTGHLVSLDPNTNRMTKHKVPDLNNDLWGLSPDSDVVGYTGAGTSKVAMLFPKFQPITVHVATSTAFQTPFGGTALTEPAAVVTGTVPGDAKVVPVQTTRNPSEGTYVEAFVNQAIACDGTQKPESLSPLGISANWTKAQGTFFYTVGFAGDTNSVARRVGHVRLPNKERLKFARDDDDADEGMNGAACPGFHAAEPGDDDADGVDDKFDTPSNREDSQRQDPTPVSPTSSPSYSVTTTATSLALIGVVESDNPTAIIAADVYNALGVMVASSGPLAGVATVTVPTPGAGNYTVRIRNLSAATVNLTPTFIVREPGLPLQ